MRVLRASPPPPTPLCAPGNRISQPCLLVALQAAADSFLSHNHSVRDATGSSSRRQDRRGVASALLPPRRKASCVSVHLRGQRHWQKNRRGSCHGCHLGRGGDGQVSCDKERRGASAHLLCPRLKVSGLRYNLGWVLPQSYPSP